MSSVSVIIPVYFEHEIINSLIYDIKTKFKGYDHEIIIVDGDLNKRTLRAVNHEGVIKISSQAGRAFQMNKGASISSKDNLFFVHADSIIHKNSFFLINETLKNYDAGAFDLSIDTENLLLKIIEKTASLRSRLTKIPYGDQGIFIRRKVFQSIGGFSNIILMEDIDLFLKLKKNKYRIKILKEKIKTSPRKWIKEGILYCSLRNIIISSLFYLRCDPEKLYKYYYK